MTGGVFFTYLVFFVVGYLFGSIPFGLLLTRLAGYGDIRAIGSGNIGATNVLRTGNKALAAATVLLDVLKGTAAVLVAWLLAPDTVLIAGLGAFLGHVFPVWLGFKGGKAVATYIGVLAALSWPAAIVFCAIWLGSAVVTRFSSASAHLASVITPVLLYFIATPPIALLFLVLTLLLWWRHSENIRRLVAGTEARIGEKR